MDHTSNPAINGDLTRRAVMDSRSMDWQPSPSGSVWRKRLHLVGPAESGQVTSLVQYQPDSSFPVHDHPGGEEILVLEGVFSDEHGDWPQGTYLLNPEGFRHAPFSREGCLIFVKLRQYAGERREHVVVETAAGAWQSGERPGVEVQTLYRDARFPEVTELERWSPGTAIGSRRYPGGVELLVIEGELADENDRYGAGTWLRLPPGAHHAPSSESGCLLYVKSGALTSLNSLQAATG